MTIAKQKYKGKGNGNAQEPYAQGSDTQRSENIHFDFKQSIAEAAYYKSERRGFSPGFEEQDCDTQHIAGADVMEKPVDTDTIGAAYFFGEQGSCLDTDRPEAVIAEGLSREP
jgi:hypothetical protein